MIPTGNPADSSDHSFSAFLFLALTCVAFRVYIQPTEGIERNLLVELINIGMALLGFARECRRLKRCH